MAAVLFRDRTAEVEAWLEQRRTRDQDRYDEVWEGVYIVNPAPRPAHGRLVMVIGRALAGAVDAAGLELANGTNVGASDDYRIPDVTVFDGADETEDEVYLRRAIVVVEIRSPGEDPEAKLPFYLQHSAEVVLVDPDARSVRWLVARPDGWLAVDHSAVVDVGVDELRAAIGWT
ncbi:hypothetical protein BH23ACT2_BH23ACT2_12350 [soil metagenome]